MKMITLSRAGHTVNADSDRSIMRALAQSIVKINVTGPLDGVVDNSGGVPAPTKALNLVSPLATFGASGSNLASAADVASALGTVRDALNTLYAKANAVAAAVGFATITFSGGGTNGSGTVAAITKTVSGASTGPAAANVNALIQRYNNAVYNLGALVNRLAEATGDDALKLNPSNQVTATLSTIPSLGTDPGAASGTGVSAAAVSAALGVYANDLASIAAVLNAVTTPGTHRVIAVR